MATITINNPKELEQYKKTITRKYWNGNEEESKLYHSLADGIKGMWETTFKELTAGTRKDTLQSELWFNLKYKDTFDAFRKARDLASNQPTKSLSRKEIGDIYNNAFTKINEFGKDFGYEKLVPTDNLDDFIKATNYIHKYNKYEIKEQAYYEFFGDPNAEYKNYLKFSEQNPADNTLIINCDIDLPDAVFDVYGNLKAKDLQCSFLGVCGEVEAKEIGCDALYAEKLTAEHVNCISRNGIKYYHLDEMTFPVVLQDAIVQGANPKKFFDDGVLRYDMIVGKMNVYDQSKSNPLKLKINGEEYFYKFATHIDMIGGEVKVNKLETENAFFGNAEINNPTINGDVFAGADYVNKQFSKLTDKQKRNLVSTLRKNPNKTSIIPINDYLAYSKNDIKIEGGFIRGIQCNNFKGNFLISDGYLTANDVNCSSLITKSTKANDVKADYIYGSSLEANNVSVQSFSMLNIMNVKNITITKEMNLPDVDKIAGNFTLTKEVVNNQPEETKKVLGLAEKKAKPSTMKQIDKSGLEK